MVNAIYFSDGYGLKKVEMSDLAGESQAQVTTVFSTTSPSPIPLDTVDSIHGEHISGDFYLVFSLSGRVTAGDTWDLSYWDDSFWGDYAPPTFFWGTSIWGSSIWGDSTDKYKGCFVAKNEVITAQYADGYKVFQPKINNRGVLYLINQITNNIEVYYGVHSRPGSREPDFVYNNSSTPAILSGDILCLNIASGASAELINGTRLYIGTTQGLTRIDTYDAESPTGFCAGLDHLGKSYTYSIASGSATYKVLGGTVPYVTAVASREEANVMLAVTNDGGGNGGLTQVSTLRNKRVSYMTHENGFIPSNDIRDVFGKY